MKQAKANEQRTRAARGGGRPSRSAGEGDAASREARKAAYLRAVHGIGPAPSRIEALVEAAAIRRMGWEVELFRGQRRPRVLYEPMRIVAPGRTFLRRRSHVFDAIVLGSWSRFGNAVVQLVNAAFYADRFGARRVLAPPGHDIFRAEGRLGAAAFEAGAIDALRPGETALVGRLYGCSAIDAGLTVGPRYAAVPRLVRPLIRPDVLEPDPRVGHEDVVAHLRSGDIFERSVPHPAYGQPPLGYYLRAIAEGAPRRVWLVYENRSNPVIEALADRLRRDGYAVVEQSATLAEDLRVMLSASRLVLGVGTLTDAVVALSRRLREMHLFGRQRDVRPPGTAIILHRWLDPTGRYVGTVQSRRWANTAEQRQLMLDYPADALEHVLEAPCPS